MASPPASGSPAPMRHSKILARIRAGSVARVCSVSAPFAAFPLDAFRADEMRGVGLRVLRDGRVPELAHVQD